MFFCRLVFVELRTFVNDAELYLNGNSLKIPNNFSYFLIPLVTYYHLFNFVSIAIYRDATVRSRCFHNHVVTQLLAREQMI